MARRIPAPIGRARIRSLVEIGLLGAVYYGAAQLGYALDIAGPVGAIVWLPAGVGIAALTLGGLALWPGVVIGDLLANDYSTLPLGTALLQTCGNLAEVLVAAWLLRRLSEQRPLLGSPAGLARLTLALAAGALISATVGVTAQRLGGVIPAEDTIGTFRTWWLGDLAGAVVVVPLVLAWRRPPPREWWRHRWPEALLVLVAVAGVSELVFSSDRPLTYLVFPALIWAAIRFGQRGATVAVAVTVGVSAWHTAHFAGPFVYFSITHGVVSAQLFILAATATTLALAAVVSERETFSTGLSASRARLVHAAQEERRRLEHNLHDGAQQSLTALGARLRTAREELRDGGGIEQSDKALVAAEEQLGFAVEELRELAHGIHPAVLTRHGLPEAIEHIAARSTVPVRVVALPTVRLDPRVEVAAYYVVAEAVTNAQKHAGASVIRVTATLSGGILRVEVADDGSGGAAESRGTGLQGLRDRVEAVGGTFAVSSVPGHGTRVGAWLFDSHPDRR